MQPSLMKDVRHVHVRKLPFRLWLDFAPAANEGNAGCDRSLAFCHWKSPFEPEVAIFTKGRKKTQK